MQLTWFPFIISPGHLFNIGRREFCGFSLSIYVCPLLLCSIFLVFQFLCNLIFSYFHLHSVPICRSISICANLGQLLYFPCIFSVFVRTFHALTITCPCNGAELRSRGKTLSPLFNFITIIILIIILIILLIIIFIIVMITCVTVDHIIVLCSS